MNFQVLPVKRIYLRRLSCAHQRLTTLVEKYNSYDKHLKTTPLTKKERRIRGDLPTFGVILTVLLDRSIQQKSSTLSLLKYSTNTNYVTL